MGSVGEGAGNVPGPVRCGSSWVAAVQELALGAQVIWVPSKDVQVTPLLYSHSCEVIWLPCEALDCSRKTDREGSGTCMQ